MDPRSYRQLLLVCCAGGVTLGLVIAMIIVAANSAQGVAPSLWLYLTVAGISVVVSVRSLWRMVPAVQR